ncbi:MAG TPA: DUF6194 family protein [Candidatus Acidoferrales bacterium]|nr:DUF6194 family protein [Candidatus Acidoferrales bacterium]
MGSADPDPETIARYIVATYRDTVVARAGGAIFFSCDESSWPNFATIVTTDEHDTWEGGPPPKSGLAREGVFRLNIGVGPETFDRIAGGRREPDYSALDTLFPHPVYAAQQWVAVLNPSAERFERDVKPLLEEAHARVATKTEQRRAATRS